MKPHTFAQMVNEVRDLAFDFGTSEQFRDRVADLLGKYIHVEHNSKGVPEQAEAPAVVVPERAAWLTIDEMEKVILNVTLHLPVKGTGMPRYIASKIAEASRAKGIRAIPADRVLGEGERKICSEEWMYLRSLERYARKHGPESIQDVIGCLDHLRASQGGAAT